MTRKPMGREALIHRHLRGMKRRGIFFRHVQTNAFLPVQVLGGSSQDVKMGIDLTNTAQVCPLTQRSLLSTSFFSMISPAKFGRLGSFYFCEVVTGL